MDISYDYYRIFYYVAKYRSFTLAAQALMANQPNITRTVKNLEAALDCTLFIRSNRGVALTPEGERLFIRVSAAFEQLAAAEEELALDKSLESGAVSIGASETALHGLLLPVLEQFHKAYPNIHLRVTNDSTPQAIGAVQKGLVDFAVVTTPTDAPPDLSQTSLLSFRELLVARADAAPQALRLEEVLRYSTVGLGQHSKTHAFYARLYSARGLEWRPDVDAATADQVLPLVQAGLGIGFVPEFMAAAGIRSGEIAQIPLLDIAIRREIVLIEKKGRHLSLAAGVLRKMLLG